MILRIGLGQYHIRYLRPPAGGTYYVHNAQRKLIESC